MSKLSERDVYTKYITPSLVSAGWDLQTQIREEVSSNYLFVRKQSLATALNQLEPSCKTALAIRMGRASPLYAHAPEADDPSPDMASSERERT